MATAISEPGSMISLGGVPARSGACAVALCRHSGKLLNLSPAHAWHAYNEQRQNYRRDGSIGTVFHALFLGKGADYEVIEADDFRTKAAQEARDEALYNGKTPIKAADFETAQVMVERAVAQLEAHEIGNFTNDRLAKRNKRCSGARTMCGAARASTGCRDHLGCGPIDAPIINLKTTTCAEPDWWQRNALRCGYDLSEAHYVRGIRQLFGLEVRELFVAIENKPPYALSVNMLPNGALAMAERKRAYAVERWGECLKRGYWPAYPSHICTLTETPGYHEAAFLERELAGPVRPGDVGQPDRCECAMNIQIDPEIANLCRSLTDAEKAGLEAELISAGKARKALDLWGDILLDGHNRLEICTKLGLNYAVDQVPGIESREQAINWVISNQLGRRNLTPTEASYLRGKLYNAEKQPHGGQKKGEPRSGSPGKAQDRLAAELGVAHSTVVNDGVFAAAVDAIAKNVGPDAAREIRGGKAALTKKKVQEIGKMPAEQQAAALKATKAKPKRPTPATLGKIKPLERAAISEAQKEAGQHFLHALRILDQLKYDPEVLARMKWPENWRGAIESKLANATNYLADFSSAWKTKENGQ